MNKDLFEKKPDPVAIVQRQNDALTKRCEELETKCRRLERENLEAQEHLRRMGDEVKRMREDMLNESLERGKVRASDPVTSFSAEEANRVIRKKQANDFIAAFRDAGDRGLTDEEAHDAVGLLSHTPRVADLKRAKFIQATGTTRPTKSGSRAKVYRLTAPARSYLNEGNGTNDHEEGGTETVGEPVTDAT